MDCENVVITITSWLKNKLEESKQTGFVVGVSGGIDSAVVSNLCAITGKKTILINMPIHQSPDQVDRSDEHIGNLEVKFDNVIKYKIDLTDVFESFVRFIPHAFKTELALANLRSRIRMSTLYCASNSLKCLVAGTGNLIEDVGIMFFTRYGDGGVDLSPIGDLFKSEVYELGRYLGVAESILKARPTDGLWHDGRTDEDQIGCSYDDLEKAMRFCIFNNIETVRDYVHCSEKIGDVSEDVLYKYLTRHEAGRYKMEMPPICLIGRLRQ